MEKCDKSGRVLPCAAPYVSVAINFKLQCCTVERISAHLSALTDNSNHIYKHCKQLSTKQYVIASPRALRPGDNTDTRAHAIFAQDEPNWFKASPKRESSNPRVHEIRADLGAVPRRRHPPQVVHEPLCLLCVERMEYKQNKALNIQITSGTEYEERILLMAQWMMC